MVMRKITVITNRHPFMVNDLEKVAFIDSSAKQSAKTHAFLPETESTIFARYIKIRDFCPTAFVQIGATKARFERI